MDENKLEEEKVGKVYFLLIAVLLCVLLTIGITVVAVTVTKKGDKVNTITTTNVMLDITESNNGISITNAMPTTDTTGKTLSKTGEYFDFNVITTVNGQAKITYEISAVKKENSSLDNNDVKLYLEKKQSGTYTEVMKPTRFIPLSSKSSLGSEKGTMILYKETTTKAKTDKYRLRMWVADDAKIDDTSRTFTVQVAIHASVKANK